MRILSLHIRNIASLVEADIDFEKGALANEPIFLISGPTGSGKSTILNSICLALYDTCPQLTDISNRERDAENIPLTNSATLVRKGAKTAEIQLVFVANNGRKYCAMWSKSRKNKRTEDPTKDLFNQKRIIKDIEANTEEKLTKELAEELTGLTYEQFTRTTILAQGRFAEFLKAGGQEKAVVLEKITGTELYSEIGAAVQEAFKEINDTLTKKTAALGELRPLSEEELQVRNERLGVLGESISVQEKTSEALQTQKTWLESQDKFDENIRGHRQKVVELEEEARKEEFLAATAQVKLFDNTVDVRSFITEREGASARMKEQSAGIAQLKQDVLPGLFGALKYLDDKIQQDTARRTELDDKINKEKPYEEAFEHAEQVTLIADGVKADRASIAKKENEIAEIEKDAISLDSELEKAEKEVARVQEEYDSANLTLKDAQKKKENIDLQALNDAVNVPAETLRHINEAQKARKALQDAAEELEKSESTSAELRKQIEAEEKTEKEHLEKRPALAQTLEVCRKLYDALASINEKIDEIRGGLESTHTCPLCGNDHANFVGTKVLSSHVEEALQQRSNAQKALDDCDKEISRAHSSIEAKTEVLKGNDAACAQKKTELQGKRDDFNRDYADVDFTDETALETHKSDLSSQIEQAKKTLADAYALIEDDKRAQKAFNAASDSLTKAKDDRDKVSEKKNANVNRRAIVRSEVTLLCDKIAEAVKTANGILPEDFQSDEPSLSTVAADFAAKATAYRDASRELSELVVSLGELTRRRDSVALQLQPFADGTQYPAATEDNPALADDVSTFLTDFSAKKALYDQAEKDCNESERKIEEWLAAHPDNDRQQLINLNQHADDISDMRNRLKAHDDALIEARSAVKTLEEQIRKHQEKKPEMADGVTPESLGIALNESKAKIDADKAEMAKIRAELESDIDLRAKVAEKEKEVRALAEEVSVWATLNSHLGTGNARFRNVAQSYVLRTLLAKANLYLRQFSTRYELTAIPGSLTISVNDNDMPGTVRAVNSLSGGESFIVSLALALALASISKTKINVDTLFIDEGFGSLDSESLTMIIDALDTLYTIGGRRIGIISHVEILKERIPTQLRLIPEGTNTSHLEIVRS